MGGRRRERRGSRCSRARGAGVPLLRFALARLIGWPRSGGAFRAREARWRGAPAPRAGLYPLAPARETPQCHQDGGFAGDFLFVAVVGDDAEADAGGVLDRPAVLLQEFAG